MRIRRRPPGAQPLAYLLPTDPYPPPQSSPPPPPQGKQGEGEGGLHLHPASATNDSAADLGDARSSSPLGRPALPMPPQDDGAVEERSRGVGLLAAQQQQQQQGPADGRKSSLEINGLHRHVPEPATNQAGELLSINGVGAAVAVTTTATTDAKAIKQKQGTKQDTSGGSGTKRAPRGPGTLLEGSRCSRKNGRGWRCSQPTLVGYALCQYHLGKGRMKSGSVATTVGRGPGQLGRTEHANKKTSSSGAAAAAAAPATAAAPKVAAKKTSAAAVAPAIAAAAPEVAADVPPPPPPPSVQHC